MALIAVFDMPILIVKSLKKAVVISDIHLNPAITKLKQSIPLLRELRCHEIDKQWDFVAHEDAVNLKSLEL